MAYISPSDTYRQVLVVGARLRSKRAQAAMIRLAEASGMPVAVMPNAKGFFPENHPNYIGRRAQPLS